MTNIRPPRESDRWALYAPADIDLSMPAAECEGAA